MFVYCRLVLIFPYRLCYNEHSGKVMSRVQLLLKNVSLTAGAIYFMTVPLHPFPGSAEIKGLSIAALAALALISGARVLPFALLASAVGDVLLDVDPKRLFVAGLCSFLVAHLIYTGLFVSRRPSPLKVPLWRIVWSVLMLVYAGAFAFWLAPDLGPLTVPVAFYICVITAMVVWAICAQLPALVPIGAMLFLISDSCLAIAKFKGSFFMRDYIVWGTYYGAQYFIAFGVLKAMAMDEYRRAGDSHHSKQATTA